MEKVKMKQYKFTLSVYGVGATPEEAWEDILQSGCIRFQYPDECYMPTQYEVVDEWDEDC